MRIRCIFLFLAFALVLHTHAQKQDDMRQAVEYLASQQLGGRFPATAGDTLASEYIVDQLRKLKPIVKEKKRKGFFHDFTFGKTEKRTTHNIIAVLPGKDKRLRNEYIVVGSHYDHLGMGGQGSGSRRPDTLGVHPGADDNASGVAAVLECARLLTTYAPADIEYNKRSIIFVLFSGGELEQLGSSIFVSNFPKLRNVECFINAECIGSGDSINVLGNKRFPQLWNIASHNDSISTKSLLRGYRTMPRGDAAPFAQIGIPSIVFTNYMGGNYDHVPSDISENINRDILTKRASLMAEVIYELSLGDYQGRSFRSKKFKFED